MNYEVKEQMYEGKAKQVFATSDPEIEMCIRDRFVPVGDNCEIDRLVLTNESDAPKSFTVFSYVEFCLWNAVDDSTNFQRNFSTGEVEVEGSTIYHKTEYRERRDHYALYTVNTPIDGFDTSRDAFLGAWRSNSNPEAVEKGACTLSLIHI